MENMNVIWICLILHSFTEKLVSSFHFHFNLHRIQYSNTHNTCSLNPSPNNDQSSILRRLQRLKRHFHHHPYSKSISNQNQSSTFVTRAKLQNFGNNKEELLNPEENPFIDQNLKSLSNVQYSTVLSGLHILYPPQDLSYRNSVSRTDGYWSYVENGEKPPQHLVYGEFDFLFFASLLDTVHKYFVDGQGRKNQMDNDYNPTIVENNDESNNEIMSSWKDKTFVDIGSGTGRLVIGAASLHPDMKLCKGIEVLPGIHSIALENLEKCRDASSNINVDDDGIDGDRFLTIPDSFIYDKDKSVDNNSLPNTDIIDEYDVEPFNPQIIEMQNSLQEMTPEEWEKILGDLGYDLNLLEDDEDDSINDDITNETNDSISYEKDEIDDILFESDTIDSIETKNERNITKEEILFIGNVEDSHWYFRLPSEEDQFEENVNMNNSTKIAEHCFQSLEEFEAMTNEEWLDTFNNNHYPNQNDIELLAQRRHLYQKKISEAVDRDMKEGLYSLKTNSDEEGTGALPMAPVEFVCASFDDPNVHIDDADIIFVYSSCMTQDMMSELSKTIGRQCKPGTIVITTEFPLILEGYIEPLDDEPFLPYGSYKHELLEKIDGYVWLTGGQASAYVHRVIDSLWNQHLIVEKNISSNLQSEAYTVIKRMEANTLTNTSKFLRGVYNSMVFHSYPDEIRPRIEND